MIVDVPANKKRGRRPKKKNRRSGENLRLPLPRFVDFLFFSNPVRRLVF